MFWVKNILYKIFGGRRKGDYETFEFEYFKPPSENLYESIYENQYESIFGETSICSNEVATRLPHQLYPHDVRDWIDGAQSHAVTTHSVWI